MTKTLMNRFLYKILISEARSRLRMAQYGVSQPICLRKSDEEDIALTKELEEELKRFNYFETEDELQQRLDVLRRINHLVRTWVRDVSIQKNLPPEQVERAGGKLFTFGSYRLGVYTRGADIDSLCVAPRHMDRSDFFTSFFACLKEDNNVTELHAVEEAFVPVIKLKYSGIELDILFARLALKEVGDDQMLDDDNLLQNLDEKSIRSLNGCRVADEILKSIPNQHAFAVALRAIKLWARNHSIYSNSLGFLGGVSWAILVARTCQLYPNASASVIIEKLFLVFSTWEWPHPVFLKDIDNSPRPDIPKLNELVWDPRNRVTDRYHLMPIITPAFPEQNSTYNVTKSTRSIMTNEFKDGLQIMLDIKAGKKFWRHLFEEINFFSRYKHFICLLCTTESEEDHLVFGSLVESKIRHLITFFERNQSVNLCHINPKKFKPLPDCQLSVPYENPVVTLWFVGLELDRQVKNLDLTNEIQQFSDLVLKQASMTENYKPTMIVRPFHVPGKELKNWISENEVAKGVKYRARKKMAQQPIGVNQKEIRDEKANSLSTASIQGGNNSQPNSSLEENGSTPMSSSNSLLPHSASSPNMEGTEDVPPAPQLPMENTVLSNSGGLMNPNVARIKAKESKLKRKTFLSSPSTINESHQMFKSTSHSSVEMSPNSMAEMNPPPIKKQRFNFLNSPQNGTVL